MAGRCCGSRLRDSSRISAPFLNASRRMPSSLRSKIHSGPVNRSWVSVAAIGSTQSGKSVTETRGATAPSPPAREHTPLWIRHMQVPDVSASATDDCRILFFGREVVEIDHQLEVGIAD